MASQENQSIGIPMNRSNILNLVKLRAKNGIPIADRVYPVFANDSIVNARYWLTFGVLSGGVKDACAQEYSRYVVERIGNRVYCESDRLNISKILKGEMSGKCYRFYNSRCEWLHASLTALQQHDNRLPVNPTWSTTRQRDGLVSRFQGIGLKQASLLLRNLGHNFDCCVIDTHILDFLIFLQWIPQQVRNVALNRRRYISIEALFKRLAYTLSVPVALLDIAVWDITRMMKDGELI